MHKLMGTPIDKKNIGLSKLLYGLRHDIDIYYLIADNADTINQCGLGKNFFGHIQQRALESIILSICKIYEDEKKRNELNSICGVFCSLLTKSPTAVDNSRLKSFTQKYGGPSDIGKPFHAIQLTIGKFRDTYKDKLDCFKTFRDKIVAHSEYGFTEDKLPSKDVIEKLFLFGADFCELVYDSFVGVVPFDLMAERGVKSSLKRLFKKLGFQDIKTDMLRFQQPAKREPAKTFLLTAES